MKYATSWDAGACTFLGVEHLQQVVVTDAIDVRRMARKRSRRQPAIGTGCRGNALAPTGARRMLVAMTDLRGELGDLAPHVAPGPWAGHEYVKGYGVFGLPWSSGHVLALRVFPENDFAPYVTVWHRDPAGVWSIYYQAPRPDVACPRYYGSAALRNEPAQIDVAWDGPDRLSVQLDHPALSWTLSLREPFALRVLNALSRRMPLWTWKPPALLLPREWIARALGLGRIKLGGIMPSGHYGILMPQRMFFIDRSEAVLDGVDLGRPARMHPNPRIGDVPLPARGVLAVGQAYFTIRDSDEYHRTRQAVGAEPTPRADDGHRAFSPG